MNPENSNIQPLYQFYSATFTTPETQPTSETTISGNLTGDTSGDIGYQIQIDSNGSAVFALGWVGPDTNGIGNYTIGAVKLEEGSTTTLPGEIAGSQYRDQYYNAGYEAGLREGQTISNELAGKNYNEGYKAGLAAGRAEGSESSNFANLFTGIFGSLLSFFLTVGNGVTLWNMSLLQIVISFVAIFVIDKVVKNLV